MTMGQRIAHQRKGLGLSQEALGDQLGVSRQSIYKWESDSALPEIDKLIALSRLFGVSVGWLLGVGEPPAPADAPAGAEGELRRPGDFERFIGEQVEVKHYQPIDGAKSHVGLLRGYDNGDVTVEVNGAERVFKKAQVAQVRLHMTI